MGMLYQRGNIWWAKYYVNGRPVYRSCKTSKRTEARRLLKRWEGDPRASTPHEDRLRLEDLLADFVTDYKTNGKRSLENAERYKARLAAWFEARRAVEITTADVRAYIAQRQAEQAANGSINRELAALKRAFNLAFKDGKLTRKPFIPMLAEDNVRTGFFSEADYLALREALPDYLRPVADFAYTFGWRKNKELLGLIWERLDLVAGTVPLDPEHSKNKRGRTVILTPGLLATLKDLRRDTSTLEARTGHRIPWVFHRAGSPLRDFRKAWRTACTMVGQGDLREDGRWVGRLFHDFRRTDVRNMVRAGIPERVAMTISGHKTRSIFDRYDIVSETDLREPARRLADSVTVTKTVTIDGERRIDQMVESQ